MRKEIDLLVSSAGGISDWISDSENRSLRRAVQENLVTFPAQVPIFKNRPRPDLQRKIAVLYFVRGWTMTDIAKRYNMARQRVGQILTAWRTRAVMEGYLQKIELETLPEPSAPSSESYHDGDAGMDIADPASARIPARSQAYDNSGKHVSIPDSLRRTDSEVMNDNVLSTSGIKPFRGESDLIERLQTIIDVLSNQLLVYSRPRFIGSRRSCDQLVTCAEQLCSRIEFHLQRGQPHNSELGRGCDEASAEEILKRARTLVEQFQKRMSEPPRASNSQLTRTNKSGLRRASLLSIRREPHRTPQSVAIRT